MEIGPLKILPFLHSKEAIFCEFHIKTKDYGSLDYLKNTIKNFNCKIVYLDLDMDEKGNIYARGIIKASKEELPIEKIRKELIDSNKFINIILKESPFKNIGIYTLIYPPSMNGTQLVILRAQHFTNMLNALKDSWGNAGATTLYYIGKMAGQDSYNALTKISNLKGKELVKLELTLGKSYGWWSKWEVSEFNAENKTLKLRIYDSIECRYVKRNKPNGHFMRGLISGFLSKMFNTEIKSEEPKCIAIGDPYCEFHFKPK